MAAENLILIIVMIGLIPIRKSDVSHNIDGFTEGCQGFYIIPIKG